MKKYEIVWKMLWPVRLYLKYSPISKGKGFFKWYCIVPVLPKDKNFIACLKSGLKIELEYREAIAYEILIYGEFESAETAYLNKNVKSGDCVFDVGANIGLISMELSKAVGENGKVFSIEPLENNIKRLEKNFAMNNIHNVTIKNMAAGISNDTKELHICKDSAYASLNCEDSKLEFNKIVKVQVESLDNIWKQAGCPSLSAIKVDVEGHELEVLKGANYILEKQSPILLLEANDKGKYKEIEKYLYKYNYVGSQPSGFKPWNFLFKKT